eukprot:c4945_g1_i1.p1 GENE.c4945_g1_i1~~c4945_g1_i1.p1  ORF type:complete len:603 (-),score=118.81 c4945_g1_i1:145-1905(-)
MYMDESSSCLVNKLVSITPMLVVNGCELGLVLLYELWCLRIKRNGQGVQKRVMLPLYRKYFVSTALLRLIIWILNFARRIFFPETEIFSTPGHPPIHDVMFAISQSVSIALACCCVHFLSQKSAGRDAICKTKIFTIQITMISFVCHCAPFVWAPVRMWPMFGLSIAIVLWLLKVGLCAATDHVPLRRTAAIVAALWFGLWRVEQSLYYLEMMVFGSSFVANCRHMTLFVTVILLQPLATYWILRVDSLHWWTIAARLGFADNLVQCVARPLLEQAFPSHLVMDYDDFVVEKRIGVGSQGHVLQVRYQSQHNRYAMKKHAAARLTNEVVHEFLSEVMILHTITPHPNVLQLYGVCLCPPSLCIVTELCETSLFAVIESSRSARTYLSPRLALLWALDVAQGMLHLHSNVPPIIHRDLKSMNILLLHSRRHARMIAKVADMGCSLLYDPDSPRPPGMMIGPWWHSGDGAAASLDQARGTVPWCAPEVLRMDPITEKCDVFSMAVFLWELSTGLDPTQPPNHEPLRISVSECTSGFRLPLEYVRVGGASMQCLIGRCWSEDPHSRPCFSEIVTHLELMLDSEANDSFN